MDHITIELEVKSSSGVIVLVFWSPKNAYDLHAIPFSRWCPTIFVNDGQADHIYPGIPLK